MVNASRLRRRVLVVEDEESVRAYVARVLTRAGYEVVEAAKAGQVAQVNALWPTGPDLLVTDLVMPGLSGLELAREMRRRFPGLPVVFMSGYSDRDLGELAQEPAVVFLQKPFVAHDLLRVVEELLNTGDSEMPSSGWRSGGKNSSTV
ncbi:MAG: response regulator [Thermoleophilia bacterium]|nr:response regulator [Thermoleophilia bacterium]